MSTQMTEANEKLQHVRGELEAMLAEPEEGQERPSAEEVAAKSAEVRDAYEARKSLAEAEKGHELLSWLKDVDPKDRPETPADPTPVAQKSIGEMFTESEAFTSYRMGSVSQDFALKRSLKALFQTTAGFEQETLRIPNLVVPAIHRPQQLIDRVRQIPTMYDTVKWMEQTVRTLPGSRGATAEGAPYQEAAMQYVQRSVDVVKKTAFIPATEEQLADVPMVQDMISTTLPTMLGELVDDDLINGPGTANNLRGVRNLANRLELAKAADESRYAALVRALGQLSVNGRCMPDLIIMHTLDWHDFVLSQSADGMYLFGLLREQGQSPWGLPVVWHDGVPRGTVIIGDFARYFFLRDRQDYRTRIAPRWHVPVTVEGTSDASMSHPGAGLTVPTGQVNIYSDVRCAACWTRPQAFAEITGWS